MHAIRICLLQKYVELDRTYPKNISAVKKGEAKKVQVTKWLKGVKSLWGQEEKPARLCRTPAYKVS